MDMVDKVTSLLVENEETRIFGEYFQKEYVGKLEQWCYAYRRDSGINTNMYVEAFHRVLKHIYMHGRVNRRLDKLLFILLKISRDKAFDRLTKLSKGKAIGASRIAAITRRHKSIGKISLANVRQCTPTKWAVTSTSDSARIYNVTEKMQAPCCSITCSACGICMHQFSCDCIDGLMANTVCKHIHLVCQWKKREYGCEAEENTQKTLEKESVLTNKVHATMDSSSNSYSATSFTNVKQKCLDELSKLQREIIECDDNEAIILAHKKLKEASIALKITTPQPLESSTTPPSSWF